MNLDPARAKSDSLTSFHHERAAPSLHDKVYLGRRNADGASEVWVTNTLPPETPTGNNPCERPLPPRLDPREHSPTGFDWGYEGSGPAQLALALLADCLGEEVAQRHYQSFKRAVVARLPESGWSLTARQIREIVAQTEQADDGRPVVVVLTAFFPLGKIVITTGVASQLSHVEMSQTLARHAKGEWGEMDEADKRTNDIGAKHGGMVVSIHRSFKGTVFWIITDPGGAATTILLPDEY